MKVYESERKRKEYKDGNWEIDRFYIESMIEFDWIYGVWNGGVGG